MSIWDRITGRKSAAATDGLSDFLSALLRGGGKSKSGANVNLDTALKVGAVFACMRVISEGVAQVPFKLMRESRSSVSKHPQRQSATDHPLFDLLHRAPNSWQTSYEYRETMVLHAGLAGNAYAFKNVVTIGGRARIAELIQLDPGRVSVIQNEDWSLTYKVRGTSGEVKEFPQETIWHLRGPSWNGVMGLDVLKLAREAIGLAISTEESHAKLHEKGVRPSGIYSVDGTLQKEQYTALKDWIAKEHAGSENAGLPMVLDRSAKFIQQVMSGVDAQHLETRRYQVEEVCRYFRVLPLMVGHSDKTQTFASAEQMFLAHVVHTLMPWYERIQQSADVNLLTKAEREQGYYIKLAEAGLLRGAMKDTAEYLYRLALGGIMERNEARGKLDLNPIAGLDEPLTPTNMTTDPSGAVSTTPSGA
ncbi:MAG: phage portal protein [Aquabacterium sp.]|nr:phage portal protein [Aquabacterium sp.]